MAAKVSKFRWRSKCAIFDYDWTIVKPLDNKTYPKDVNDWSWFRSSVKETIQNLYKKGYGIVIMTNQSKQWKEDQIRIVTEDLGIPVLTCIANEKSLYKPDTTIFKKAMGNKKLDLDKSMMIGDALGRKNDYADVDKKFAEALGISKIYPPETFFPEDEKPRQVIVKPSKKKEIIVMVGYPGSGKSTFAQEIFGDYFICAGDEHKTSKKMIKVADEYVKKGMSIVFDATNPSKVGRAVYIEYARSKNMPIRCIHITTSMAESLIRNNKREKPIPKIVYNIYKSKFEEPNITEGFYDVIHI
jgi:bifunctional polynucleotide phosphatase/kinase